MRQVKTLEISPEVDQATRTKIREDLEKQGCTIVAMYCYWYEGVGKERIVVQDGPNVKAFQDPLSIKQKLAMLASHPSTTDLRELYMEAVRKDYELLGGVREFTGALEDATVVIEYEEP